MEPAWVARERLGRVVDQVVDAPEARAKGGAEELNLRSVGPPARRA